MVEMCEIAGNRDHLINLLLPLAEHLLNVVLVHFQDGYDLLWNDICYCCIIYHYPLKLFIGRSIISDTGGAMKMITYGGKSDSGHDISVLCEKLVPTLERLESLSEVCCLLIPLLVIYLLNLCVIKRHCSFIC